MNSLECRLAYATGRQHSNGPFDIILWKELGVYVVAYLDDVIVFSKSKTDHVKRVENVLLKLKSAGISLNKSKCKFIDRN